MGSHVKGLQAISSRKGQGCIHSVEHIFLEIPSTSSKNFYVRTNQQQFGHLFSMLTADEPEL